MLARKRAPRIRGAHAAGSRPMGGHTPEVGGHTPEAAVAFGAGGGLPTGTAHLKETVNG